MLPDWIELCALFNAHRVDFLLIGGQAVIAHGYPRLTKDMDLWVRPTTGNGARLLLALAEFGKDIPGFTAERFSDPATIVMLGRENSTDVALISKEDLITNKKAVGRLQDLADVEALEAVKS